MEYTNEQLDIIGCLIKQRICNNIVDELLYQKLSDCVEHKLQGCSDEIIRQEIESFVEQYRDLLFG